MWFVLGMVVGAMAAVSVPAVGSWAGKARDWLAVKVRNFRIPPGQD